MRPSDSAMTQIYKFKWKHPHSIISSISNVIANFSNVNRSQCSLVNILT